MVMVMEMKVLWVYQLVKIPHGTIEAGQKPSLCFKGRKYMLCVSAGHPVRVIKRPVKDFDVLRRVNYDVSNMVEGKSVITTKEYTVEQAVNTLKGMVERCGITAGASKLLDLAVATAAKTLSEKEEEDFQDEEDLMTVKGENTKPVADAGDETPRTDDQSTATEPKAPKETDVATKKKGGKKAKGKAVKAKSKSAAKKSTSKRGPNRDFVKEVLPIIVKEFMKLKPAERKDRPRGFGVKVYGVLEARLKINRNAADQYFWKAVWNFASDLGIPGGKNTK